MYPPRNDARRYLTLAVIGLATAAAVLMFVEANTDPDLLWRGYYHDRNGHYAFGQDLALAVRTADPVWFFTELLKAQVWPPVHGLVVAAVLLVGGIDHRLGIVPSLLGWAITIVLVAEIAQRMFRERQLGMAAAVVAVMLGIASPAFRLLACDVMLECLGAALSAAAVWAYGRAMTPIEPADNAKETSRWRVLAVILTLLFFEKGNYWGLVVAALAVTHVINAMAGDPHRWIAAARRSVCRENILLVARALPDPFFIVAALLGCLVAYLYARGPTSIVLLGKAVSVYPPENLVTVTYAVLYARFALWWWRHRSAWDAALGPRGRALYYWHLTPVAVSFLFPHRLSVFLWYVGPADATTGFDPVDGLVVYWHAFAEGFSATQWSVMLTIGLFAIGLTQLRRFPPGGQAAFFLALVAFTGVIIHPQHQGRFLGSWIFAVWIGAGAGAAVLLERLMPKRTWLPSAGIAGLALAIALARPVPASAYATALYPVEGLSDLDFVRPLLPKLHGEPSIAYATTFGESTLLVWVAREHCRCKLVVENTSIGRVASRQEAQTQMAARVASSPAPLFVIFDAPGRLYEFPLLGWTYDRMVGIVDAMKAQDRYVQVANLPMPRFGMEVTLWRLRDAAGNAADRRG